MNVARITYDHLILICDYSTRHEAAASFETKKRFEFEPKVPIFALRWHNQTLMNEIAAAELFAWLSESGAAAFLDVSPDTISRRAIPWPEDDKPVRGKLRYKLLNLGGTKKDRRYPVEDLEAMLQKH